MYTWNDAKTILPPTNNPVLLCCRDKNTGMVFSGGMCGFFTGEEWRQNVAPFATQTLGAKGSNIEVLYWMYFPGPPEKEPKNRTPIENLNLSVRAFNALKRHNIGTVDELLDVVKKEELLKIKNMGERTAVEIVKRLDELGLLPKEENHHE